MNLDFEKCGGLIPAIIQDNTTNKVLMLGYMNQEALDKTNEIGKVTFYSRTKQRLWTKGEESGNFLNVVSIAKDCDDDTLLIKANPVGPVCHTGSDTCFEEVNQSADFLSHLEEFIWKRKAQMPEGSYTTHLFNKGINKIAQKVGEEAVELIIEAKDDNKELFLGEAADLIYHLIVLLTEKGYKFGEIIEVLRGRHKTS